MKTRSFWKPDKYQPPPISRGQQKPDDEFSIQPKGGGAAVLVSNTPTLHRLHGTGRLTYICPYLLHFAPQKKHKEQNNKTH